MSHGGRHAAWLLVAALACAPPAAPLRPEPPEPSDLFCGPTECPPCEDRVITRVVTRRARCRVPPLPPPPDVAWAPPGCPVRRFGACLSPADFAALLHYRQAIATWQVAANGCLDGP